MSVSNELPRLASDAVFVPQHQLGDRPHITVDGAAARGSVLALAHWPGSPTPPQFAAATATAIVARYLDCPAGGPVVDAVSNNHYDADGLLAAWLLLERPATDSPERRLALAAAEAGDFGTWTDPRAIRVALALMAFAEPATTPLAAVRRLLHPGLDHDPAGELCVVVLPRVRRVLSDPERFSYLWQSPWQVIATDIDLLDSGDAQIGDVPEADLAVVRAPRQLVGPAVHPRTTRSRVLDVTPDGTMIFRYRYETWVRWTARPLPPRRDLATVIDALNEAETAPGTWRFDGTEFPNARMFCADTAGRPMPSRLPVDQVVQELVRALSPG